jgi:hypothetical protein
LGVALALFDVVYCEFDVYRVEDFAEVWGDYYGTIRRLFFVEAVSDLVGKS